MSTSAMLKIEEVVSWLEAKERLAGSLYTKAALIFSNDKEFSSFLSQLAKDEKLHEYFMSIVSENLTKVNKQILRDIVLDEKTINTVDSLFGKFYNLLNQDTVSKKQMIEYIVRAEFSELNPAFLYIAGTFG